ncbi:MAG: carbohydrate ABC transporter permease [Christensenellales bacterium]|jgi:sn-glycerol 3-phosphate transport system permease protein|nr:carbohydrate ABC transporter permease [Clostridiales bacterium]
MKKSKGSQIIFAILGFFLAAVILSPLIYCLSTSFMTEQEIYASKLVPSRIGLDNYRSALRVAPIFRFILNSTIVACTCTFMQLLTGALAGYAFGSLKFRGRKVLFYLILATMMIPGNAIIIANYLTMAKLQALDSYRALILPYMTSAFCIFNMRQAFLSLPSDLQEAATIDGCNSLQFFVRVGLPLTLPSLGALGIYTFLQIWNQYLWPLLVTNTINLRTVQIGIGMLQNADSVAYGPIMAGTTMVLIPSILVFVLGQKSLISGLTAGAVKG